MIKSTVKPSTTSTTPSKSSTKPVSKLSTKSPTSANTAPIPKPVVKETPKNTVNPTQNPAPKSVIKHTPKPLVEEKPPKPVKEAAKHIETNVMKEKQEKHAAKLANPTTESIKANGKTLANAPVKSTANDTKMDTNTKSEENPAPKKGVEDIVFAWTPEGAENVQISGSFNDWKEKLDMKIVGSTHELSIPLKPGKYLYKFIVDGEWCYDFTAPNEQDDEGNVNNVITV